MNTPSATNRPSQSPDTQTAAELAALPDEALLEAVQRRTFRYFWEGAHPASGLAFDRRTGRDADIGDSGGEDCPVTVGGSGFGIMTLIVAVERGWITRAAALERLDGMLAVLARAPCYHGIWPHFLHGRSGATIAFGRKDDGGDLVETSFLCMALLCARQYFDRDTPAEKALRGRATGLWQEVEWDWHTQGGRSLLYWHWSPNNGWAMDHEIHGWNECLITYLLAAAAPRHGVDPGVYHRGFAAGRDFLNGKSYYGIELPLGVPYGGPLFFTHYSFLGLDPRGLADRYADYWEQNRRHVRIQYAHALANPHHYEGYGAGGWGLTASDDPDGYAAHAPDHDNGTLSPTAALSSLPYAPQEAMQALRHFLDVGGGRLWGRYGFIDAYCPRRAWYADTFLAIDQGPIVIMIENYRTGLLWRLFMSVPEVQAGLRRLEFISPYLNPPSAPAAGSG